MKRLVRIGNNYSPNIGDHVIFKNHPYDRSVYEITNILNDGTVMMENNEGAYIGISTRKITFLY